MMEKQYEYTMKKKNIESALVGKLEYRKWIILWDLLNDDYCHIAHDIRIGKISKNDLKDVIEKANKIENIYDKDYVFNKLGM